MNVYCVMRGEARSDLDHVVYASTSKADAERFARRYNFYDYSGEPDIEVLDVTIADTLETLKHTRWIINHNGTISCSYCHALFYVWSYEDGTHLYPRCCPCCKAEMVEM